jgi:O-antigen ligase
MQSYQKGGLITVAFNGIFITKAGATYFLMWPFLIICGYLSYLFSKGVEEEINKLYLFRILSSAVILVLIFLAFFTLHSLNGLLVSSMIALLLIMRISIFGIKRSSHKKLSIFIALLLISAAILTLHGNTKNDNGKLENLFRDIQIGKEVDLYPNWRNYTHVPWTPHIDHKTPVNQSTYYRVANAIEGLRLLKEHPLGAGFTFLPYGFYLSKLYPGSNSDHTHSGWIDFALGVGIPGLMLCWSAFLLITYNAINKLRDKNYKLWAHITIWSLGGIFVLWIFLEVSEKEYIEHLILMLSLFSAGLMVSDKSRS